ncbi:putative bifunctional diguanylate cyclase/phosphodiesterase [Methylophaga sp.]|uniref:putative bifunctional diguanylate cyclase/phosphodiesterase n=1 Tax=Methylophaga sp. TaxID=2024840 RepID=UPI003F6A28D5
MIKSRNTLFSIGLISLALLIITAIYYSLHTGRAIAKGYTPLVNATMKIQLDTTLAHLWFEESLGGDTSIDINNVWTHLDEAEWYAQAILDGNKGIVDNNPDLRPAIEQTLQALRSFRVIAKSRWQAQITSLPGSELDQELDRIFIRLNDSVGKAEKILNNTINEKLRDYELIQNLLIVLVSVSGLLMAYFLYMNDRIRTRQMRELNNKEEKLEATLAQRDRDTDKLKLAASVFTNARESITITDADGTIIDVNDTFTSVTGYSREEVIGKNSRLLKSGKQSARFYDELWNSLLKDGHWYGEIWNRRKNGEVYPEMKTISAIRDEDGITTHYVALCTEVTQMKKNQEQLEHIAHFDLLTSLPNRTVLEDRLNQAIAQCRRKKLTLAVAFLDLDGFKWVNDTFGHEVGDELLIAVSHKMKEVLREGDTLARIGGDEFVAVLVDLDKVEDCQPVLERLLAATADPVTVDEKILKVSSSIGVTLYPDDDVDADHLIRHADQAMYIAKQAGKNRYHLFNTEQDDAVKVQRENIEAIRQALDNEQFVLYYQPKVNMRTGSVIGAEALIRWQHPEKGLLTPHEFLHIIDDHIMSVELGEWVIETVLTQISQWHEMGINLPISISVNIAAVQLQQNNFLNKLKALLAAHPTVDPSYLELEVLETSALDNLMHTSSIMNECIALGVSFSLDDFGTGYSSLTYLRRLPASIIKIDQSFVRDMLVDPDDLAIVEGVIALAKSFKRNVIAEGVETVEHGTALLQLGCELAQGYGIAKPMPATDIVDWVTDWKPYEDWQS